jgi:hypothetical protein
MKRVVSILLITILLSVLFITSGTAATVSIKGPSKPKAGPSVARDSYMDWATINLTAWAYCHDDIQVWVWKDGYKQVTSAYWFQGLYSHDFVYLAPSYEVYGDNYHPVWKTNPDVPATTTATVTYSFTP